MKQLPELSTLKITQSSARLTKAHCDRLDHLAVIVPKKPARTLFKTLPFGEHLRKSFERGSDRGAGRSASRLPNARAQVRVLGIPDRFVEHMTSREEQLAAAGIDADSVERVVRTLLQPKLV